jgi:hypothetical protein
VKVKFKKRFKSIIQYSAFVLKYLSIEGNISMSAIMTKSKSRNKKRTYYHLVGWYELEPKEGNDDL